ncbi:MAG: ABC transporter ATP-binding protein [Candidatus Enteromonas sp.]|nr:ABC transporter ATP-binding protein [Candidatus Enteromonas sp.]
MASRRGLKGKPAALSAKETASILKRLFGLMFHYFPLALPLTGLATILAASANVVGSVFTGQVVVGHYVKLMLGQPSELVSNGSWLVGILPTGDNGFLLAVLMMAGIYLLGITSNFFAQFMSALIGQGTQKHIRDDLFSHMETLPLSYFDTHYHGDIMSIYTNDIDTLREMTSRVLPLLVNSLVSILVAFFAMLFSSWILLLLVLAFTAAILFVVLFVTKQSAKFFIGQQMSLGKVDGYIQEMISGQKVIKVFNHEAQAIEGFRERNDTLCEYTTKAQKFSSILGPVVNNMSNFLYCVLILVGSIGTVNAWPTFSVGVVVSFLGLGRTFTMPIMQIANQINMLTMALAGAKRVFDMTDSPSEVDEGYVTLVRAKSGHDGEPVETEEYTGLWAWKHPHSDGSGVDYVWLRGKVNLNGVDFGYTPEKTVLHDITLYAEPGQKVAFVGPTGAGKTTITNLLSRFYDIADGKIRIDGINVNKIKKRDLRIAIGMVLQDTNLFTGTVRDNIRYGNPEATDEDIVRAAKLANADNFIRMLPQGYDTVLHGAGAGLSQGQRQLISIARAACANPPILILDEATSSIDSRTEKLVQKGMDAIMKGRTVFVIAHRLSTIQNSDVIMVLQDGRIIERGSHEALLAEKGKYYQLYTGGKSPSPKAD